MLPLTHGAGLETIRCLLGPPSNCVTATDKEGKQTYFQPINFVASVYGEHLLVDEFADFEQVPWSPCYPIEAHCATFISYSKAEVSVSCFISPLNRASFPQNVNAIYFFNSH